MKEVQGLSGFGGISGYIAITVWFTERVLDRLEGIAVHDFHHDVRCSVGGVIWDPAAVYGDQKAGPFVSNNPVGAPAA